MLLSCLRKNLRVYLISSCFFRSTFIRSKSGDCFISLSCSSGSCLIMPSVIFAISFRSVIASSACICVRSSSSVGGSCFLNHCLILLSFGGFGVSSAW